MLMRERVLDGLLLIGLLVGIPVLAGLGWAVLQNPFFNDLPWLALPFFAVGALATLRRRWALVVLFDLCGLGWVGSVWMAPTGPAPVELLVFGVDGATFDVIDKHPEELPAFTQLRTDGTRAVLTSIEPMFSPVLWTTIASGRSPDEHGIRGFHVRSSDCRVARFWDVAENAGWRIGLYKWLVDYPPREVAGFWVPSWLAPAPETWPSSLMAVKEVELSRRLRRKQVAQEHGDFDLLMQLIPIGVRLSTLVEAAFWMVEDRLLQPDLVRKNVAMQLLRGRMDRDVFVRQLYGEKPRLATFTYYATDGLAHLYWDRYVRGEDQLLSAYRQADGILAELRSHLGPQARLILVSDHGFQAMDGSGLAGQFAPTTERLRQRLSEKIGTVDVSKVGHKLTVAFSSVQQREALLPVLATLVDRDGDPVYRVEEVPENKLSIALTLVDERISAERLQSDRVGGEPLSDYVRLTDAYTGTHEGRGIFYAVGAGIPRGKELDALSLYDAAPTILAAAGLPASEQMRGKAALFPELPRVQTWDHLIPGLTWLDGKQGVNEEQLKALGYMEP